MVDEYDSTRYVTTLRYIQDVVDPVLFIRGTQPRFPSKYVENTFWAIQSTFRSIEMHCKRRYKILICSVILGELKSFRNYKGFSASCMMAGARDYGKGEERKVKVFIPRFSPSHPSSRLVYYEEVKDVKDKQIGYK